jgi:micrococcal nuclease
MRRLAFFAVLAILLLGCEPGTGGEPPDASGGQSGVSPASPDSPPDTGADEGPTQTGPNPDASPTLPGPDPDVSSEGSDLETAVVTRVVDGDTIDVEVGGEIIRRRYIGIDTPETVDPGSPVECFGPQASQRNQDLVAGRTVELERDVEETDVYGRQLRYVYVGGQMVNEELVADGYATVTTFPPNVKYVERFTAAQAAAREAGRGLWGFCFDDEPVGGEGACPEGCVSPPPGCEIKGNINSEGVKIYHVPAGQFYDATVIDTLRDERWFCTPEEAIANGWRASRR